MVIAKWMTSKVFGTAAGLIVVLSLGWYLDHNRLTTRVSDLEVKLEVISQKFGELERLTAQRKSELEAAQGRIETLQKEGRKVVTRVITREIPSDCTKAGPTAIDMLEDFNRRAQ